MWMRGLLVLVGLVVIGFTGCSSHHGRSYGAPPGEYHWDKAGRDMDRLVETHVKDPEKAKQVNAIMGEIIAEMKASRAQSREYHRKLYELNAIYDASPEEFTRVLDELNNNRMRAAAKILGLRFKMKTLITAEEWKALSDDMKSYGSRYFGTGTDKAAGGS